jgi:hypothetical protein
MGYIFLFRGVQLLIWGLYSIFSLLLCIWLAWHVWAQVNFLYPTWYQWLEIDQTIEKTMPRHLYKKEFIQTDAFEHQRLFGEIVEAVQNQGRGLEQITFYDTSGEPLGKLLTMNEIIHLQDVARLVSQFNWISVGLFASCIILLGLVFLSGIKMPALKTMVFGVMAFVAASALAVIIFGAKKFFYWLHTVIFPDNHQWFFYYEESLMSTLMKAPALFAPISILLISLGLVFWLLQLGLLNWLDSNKNHNGH